MTKQLWLAAALMAPLALHAQQQTGSLHGHAQDPAETPLANAQIQVSTDGKTALYTFTADANGDYKGDNIKPGTYVVTMFIKGPNDANIKPVDRFENVKIDAGANVVQDFDLSRPDYVKKLPPDQQKAIADAKTKNAGIQKENAQVKNLNADLKSARQNIKDKKFDDAATLMQKDTAAKPDAAVLWVELAIAQNGQKKYDDAITSGKKAIETNAASKKPSPEIEGAANNTLGEAYAATNKIPDSTAAYEAAAKAQPSQAGMFYRNELIILSRLNPTADDQKIALANQTIAAANKVISVDPKVSFPYYFKASALLRIQPPDFKASKEAYQKYLEIEPNGPFAADSKEQVQALEAQLKKDSSSGKK